MDAICCCYVTCTSRRRLQWLPLLTLGIVLTLETLANASANGTYTILCTDVKLVQGSVITFCDICTSMFCYNCHLRLLPECRRKFYTAACQEFFPMQGTVHVLHGKKSKKDNNNLKKK